ncbi:MAG: hypothetical protein V4509_00605 [Patescibacteria group bacterium]
MALENREGGRYFTILGGKFCQRVGDNAEGAISRVNKMGKTVFEKFYESFTGTLVDIKVKESSEYGPSWVFDFIDTEDENSPVYHLQMSYSNSLAIAFLKMLPNIDLSKPFKLSPSMKVEDGKNKYSIFVNQNGVPVKHAFNKENPNGLPDLEQIKVKGVDTWDNTKRLDFLFNMVQKQILPKLGKVATQTTQLAPSKTSDEALEDFASDLRGETEDEF